MRYLLPCIVLLLAVPAFAASPAQQPSEAGPFTELTLRIAIADKPVLPMEAVPVMVTVSNKTNHPVRGHTMLSPGDGWLVVYLAPAGMPFGVVSVRTEAHADYIGGVGRSLPSGFTETRQTCLWWGDTVEGQTRAFFPRPGRYRVKTALYEQQGRKVAIESNVVIVKVVEPTGVDAQAWCYIKRQSSEYEHFFFGGSRYQIPVLREVAERFPTSRYASYAWSAIAQNGLEIRDRKEAFSAYEKALCWADSPLREATLSILVRLAAREGDVPTAQKYLTMLEREFPGSEHISYAKWSIRHLSDKK